MLQGFIFVKNQMKKRKMIVRPYDKLSTDGSYLVVVDNNIHKLTDYIEYLTEECKRKVNKKYTAIREIP